MNGVIHFFIIVVGSVFFLLAKHAYSADVLMYGFHVPQSRMAPGKNPPVAWDIKKKKGIRWRQNLSIGGQPVVYKDVVLTTVEPHDVVQMASNDGRVMWRTSLPITSPPVIGQKGDHNPFLSWVPAVSPQGIVIAANTGELTCLEHDGTLRWHHKIGEPHPFWHTARHGYSPLIIGNRVISAVVTGNKRGAFIATDIKTGAEIWRHDVEKQHPRPFAGITLQNRAGILTADGRLIDAQDGGLLARCVDMPIGEVPPIIAGNVGYFAGHNGAAAVVFEQMADGFTAKVRWQHKRRNWNGAPGIVHKNMFLMQRVSKKFNYKMPVPWNQLDIYDCESGKRSRILPVIRSGLAPLPLHVVGDMLLVPDRGTSGHDQKVHGIELGYVDLSGPEPKLESLMSLPKGTQVSGIAATNGTLFIRTHSHLICAAADSPEGIAYEQKQSAQRVLNRIGGRPRPVTIIEAPALASLQETSRAHPFVARQVPQGWLVAGPIPDAEPWSMTVDHLAPVVGDQLASATQWRKLVAGERVRLGPEGDESAGYGLALRSLFGERHNSYVLAHTLIEVEEPATVQYSSRSAEQVWIGAKPIGKRDIIRLAAGTHAVTVRIAIKEPLPPNIDPVVAPRFRDVVDPKDRLRLWYDSIRLAQPRLQNVIADHPDSPQAAHARSLLRQLQAIE